MSREYYETKHDYHSEHFNYPRLCRWLDWFRYGTGHKLLDVACGTGISAIWAYSYSYQYIGIDYAFSPLRTGLIQADGEKMPFRDGKFDYVCILGSLEHFDSPIDGLHEISRVLRKGGLCVISVPNRPIIEELGLYSGTEQPQELRLTFNEWKHLIEKAGLQVKSWRKDYGPRVFKNHILLKVIQRFLLKLTVFLPKCFSYQFIFNCIK